MAEVDIYGNLINGGNMVTYTVGTRGPVMGNVINKTRNDTVHRDNHGNTILNLVCLLGTAVVVNIHMWTNLRANYGN